MATKTYEPNDEGARKFEEIRKRNAEKKPPLPLRPSTSSSANKSTSENSEG